MMITVLLVDDNETSRRGLRKLLLSRGYVVLEATGAVMAMAMLRASKTPDVVITDVSMPDIDGIELLARIRRCAPLTPVIALTGRMGADVTGAGFDLVLDKPCEIEEVIEAIASVLDEG